MSEWHENKLLSTTTKRNEEMKDCMFSNKCLECNLKVLLLLLSVVLVISSGCVFKKPYVGLKVDTRKWETYLPGLTHYIQTDDFEFEIKIIETGNEGEYFLEGSLDGKRGSLKSFNHLVIQDCRFSIVLAHKNVIVDNLVFFPRGDDHRNKLPFSRTFKTVPFDSFTLTYSVSVRS